jgi:hypothetical protein
MAYTDNFSTALLTLVTDLVSAEKMELSEMLFEQTFEESDIATQHEVVTGVRHGHVVPILKDTPNPESFPFVDPKSCAPTDCDVTQEFSSTKWELGLLECRVSICLRTFDENFLKFFNTIRHTQEGEPNLDSAIIQFISGKFTRNLELAKWRASYFGDTSSVSAYFNGFDGIFAQAEANADHVVTITENDGVDNNAQQFADGEAVYNYLIAMYDKAAAYAWFDPSILEYRVTKTMSIKLITWLNKLGKSAPMNCACIDPAQAVAKNVYTIEGLTINGIPVLTHREWDDIINYSTELNGGGGAAAKVNPHRALLSVRRNVLIGTSETEALSSFDVWYSKDDKKVYLEGSSYIGAALPLDEYILAI